MANHQNHQGCRESSNVLKVGQFFRRRGDPHMVQYRVTGRRPIPGEGEMVIGFEITGAMVKGPSGWEPTTVTVGPNEMIVKIIPRRGKNRPRRAQATSSV